jgi:uncharacterized protein HemY
MNRKQNNVKVLDWTPHHHHRLPRAQSEQGLAKIRAGPYRKCETERKTTKEKEKTEQLRIASQPASQPAREAERRKERNGEVDVCENEGQQSSKNNMGNYPKTAPKRH